LLGESGEAGVDARGVGVEERAFGGRDGGEDGAGEGAETVETRGAVAGDGGGAEEFGEFAGGGAAQEIHLEEAFLRVEPAEGAGDIGAALATDRGHAEGVARDRHRRTETGGGGGAVEQREAGAHARVEPTAGDGGEEEQGADEGGGEAEDFAGAEGHGRGSGGA
jgi:hypothetical protein